MLCIAYKKVIVLKFKMKFHQETKPSDISSNSLKLLVRCSGFYHNLYVWYHDHLTKFVIFQLHLNFIYFFTFLPHDIHHNTRTKCKKIQLHFMYMVLEMSHEHEYHFSNKFALWFYTLAVHIRRIRNKYKERSEIVKCSKQRQNGANFEHVHCTSVCGSRKKFELENVKFFWENSSWAE
jgi:hypothetical protein